MNGNGAALRLGGWARSGEFVGVVAQIDGDEVTLFSPGDRRMTRVPLAQAQPLPAAAVTATASVTVPLAHGVPEQTLRRWVATLTDDVLRERAHEALAEAGLDPGAVLPRATVEVTPGDPASAVCLCGAQTPATSAGGQMCPSCGRAAFPGPPRSDDPR